MGRHSGVSASVQQIHKTRVRIRARHNKSLDASRDSVFRMKLLHVKLALPRGRVNSAVGFLFMTSETVELFTAFADMERPDLRGIHPLGCCEEHEPDYAWYRNHLWEDFARELPNGGFDPFDFGSIHPIAFHYFSPGVLLATCEAVLTNAE